MIPTVRESDRCLGENFMEINDSPQCFDYLVIVCQGFTITHEHDVGNHFSALILLLTVSTCSTISWDLTVLLNPNFPVRQKRQFMHINLGWRCRG